MEIELPLIYGFNKSSEAGDDPFACSIFIGGCNMRCPYCMNMSIIDKKNMPLTTINIKNVKTYITENNVKNIMISGGEPTLIPHHDIINLIGQFKDMGCNVGISTNGTMPNKLSKILSYINFVAMDIKTSSPGIYDQITIAGKRSSTSAAWNNLIYSHNIIKEEHLCRDDFNYEIRTTLFPPFVKEDDIYNIGEKFVIEGDRWVLQQFRLTKMLKSCDVNGIIPYSIEKIEEFKVIAEKYTKKVIVRYV